VIVVVMMVMVVVMMMVVAAVVVVMMMVVVVVAIVATTVLVVRRRGVLGDRDMCRWRDHMPDRARHLVSGGGCVPHATECRHDNQDAGCQTDRNRVASGRAPAVRWVHLLGDRGDELLTSRRATGSQTLLDAVSLPESLHNLSPRMVG
jgi:hypothetical protein